MWPQTLAPSSSHLIKPSSPVPHSRLLPSLPPLRFSFSSISPPPLLHRVRLAAAMESVADWGLTPLSAVDPEIHDLIEHEKRRQSHGIELIASENFTSFAVIEALGSALTNKYSEGMPGNRYYGGNEHIDAIENLCRSRALGAFRLDPARWGVNVQPYSGSPANFAAYTALLNPHDRIMGLDLPSGGHLTHGYYTSGGKKISATSIYFESLPYKVSSVTGYIDYDKLEEKALDFRPKLIICGGSAYPRDWDYARFRKGSKPPKKGQPEDAVYDFEDKINFAVFPALQGGPHNHQIAALAVALKQATSPGFKTYTKQVKANAVALGNYLMSKGYKLVTDGTENHLVLWDLRPLGLTGNKVEKLCDLCNITVNKNAVFGDSSALAPGGVRIGTPAMTSRGLIEKDFEQIAEFLHQAVTLCLSIQKEHGKLLKDFNKGLANNKDIEELKAAVDKFASSFDMPGFHMSAMKYKAVFWVIGSSASLLIFVVFRGAALLIVALIRLLSIPGRASNDALELAGGLIRSALDHAVELLKDALASLVSSSFDAAAGAATGSLQLTTSAVVELVEKTRSALEGLSEVFPRAFEGLWETVVEVADSLWSSFVDAVGYVMENA
ncbi:hypothetical protein B296_00001167 [Ensete ventricosum]|uniref:glycine hydroxymethyltransferase n=1 Tax=Ensete ventricosum TaxID=4639 RepID=A0A427BBX2_ENSVE|nr:hypothetical protein B296_00001167 [Ensete ventricosum]